MKSPRSQSWMKATGLAVLASLVCVASVSGQCDTSNISKKFAVVQLSIQSGDNGLEIIVSPDPVPLKRGVIRAPRRVWWQVSPDAMSAGATWTIEWKGTYKVDASGNKVKIDGWDPLEEAPGRHDRDIPAAGAPNKPGCVTSPHGTGFHKNAPHAEVRWTYLVTANWDNHHLQKIVKDPIVIWP